MKSNPSKKIESTKSLLRNSVKEFSLTSIASMLFRGLAAAPGTPHSGRKVDQQQRDVTATALATPLRQGQGRFRLVKVRWMTAACRLMQALLQDSLGKPRGEVEALTQLSRRREWFLFHTKPLAMNTEKYHDCH